MQQGVVTGKKQRGKTWIKYAGTPKTFFPPQCRDTSLNFMLSFRCFPFFPKEKKPGNLHIVLDGAVQSLRANV